MTGIRDALGMIASIFTNLFGSPSWHNLLDILIVAILIYQVLKLFVHTRASSLIKGVLMVLVVTWLSELAQLNTLTWILHQLLSTGILVIIILFQPELRRGLSQLGRARGMWSALLAPGGSDMRRQEQIINEMTTALLDLSRKRIGALIVVKRQTGLEDIMESGTRLDAEISAALIENIFEPNTPLHDGAAIIEDNRIVAAACILQLTDDISLSRELGTRHRAAIGVSETTDAVVLIVSEETGIISTARDGKLVRHLDKKALTALLGELFMPQEVTLRESISRAIARLRETGNEGQ